MKSCQHINHNDLQYYKYSNIDYVKEGGDVFTEFENGVATRQINSAGDILLISSSLTDWHEKLGFLLYDGVINDLDLSDSIPISQFEFERKWKEALEFEHNRSKLVYSEGDASLALENNTIIIHVVNLIGAWGEGFVLSLSKHYPKLKESYLAWSKDKGTFKLGEVQFKCVDEDKNIFVANMLAQSGVKKSPSDNKRYIDYESLELCLSKVARFSLVNRLSIQMPKIGAGLAGGEWERIEKMINNKLVYYKIKCTVYEL